MQHKDPTMTNWVSIDIPESVQKQAQASEKTYHELIAMGLRVEAGTIERYQALKIAQNELKRLQEDRT